METQIQDAIILDSEQKSFKGRDGSEVTYRKVRLLDDNNNYHELTAPADLDWGDLDPDQVFRLSCNATINIEEVQGPSGTRLKKRLIRFS
jgi:hypothetical protein